MGLDVSFSTKEALAKGLEIRVGYNDWSSIGEKDELCNVLHVPGTDITVDASVYVDNICVRANKWGRVYAPLTEWLKANDIPWSEF